MFHWWIELFYQMHAVSIAVLFNLITWLYCWFISVTHLLVLKNTRNLQEKSIRYKNQAKLFLYINLSQVRKKYIYMLVWSPCFHLIRASWNCPVDTSEYLAMTYDPLCCWNGSAATGMSMENKKSRCSQIS